MDSYDFSTWDYDARLTSFKRWPYKSGNLKASKCAMAGFVYSPEKKGSDNVSCVLCYKNLEFWESEDSFEKEHAIHSPECPFQKLKDVGNWTAEDYIDILIFKIEHEGKKKMNFKIEEFTLATKKVESLLVKK